MDRKIKTLIRAGYYSSEFEVIKDAMISLFRENTELKINAAIELYKEGEVSLGKAVEIAGVTTIEFKEILGKRGIIREIEARPAEKMDRKLKNTSKHDFRYRYFHHLLHAFARSHINNCTGQFKWFFARLCLKDISKVAQTVY